MSHKRDQLHELDDRFYGRFLSGLNQSTAGKSDPLVSVELAAPLQNTVEVELRRVEIGLIEPRIQGTMRGGRCAVLDGSGDGDRHRPTRMRA